MKTEKDFYTRYLGWGCWWWLCYAFGEFWSLWNLWHNDRLPFALGLLICVTVWGISNARRLDTATKYMYFDKYSIKPRF